MQTRTLWLLGPQTEGEGAVDCAGGIGLPNDWPCVPWLPCVPCKLVCASAPDWSNSNRRKADNPRLIMYLELVMQKLRLDATRSASQHDADFRGTEGVPYHGNMAGPSFRSPAPFRREAKRETWHDWLLGPQADRLGLIVAAIEKYCLAALNSDLIEQAT